MRVVLFFLVLFSTSSEAFYQFNREQDYCLFNLQLKGNALLVVNLDKSVTIRAYKDRLEEGLESVQVILDSPYLGYINEKSIFQNGKLKEYHYEFKFGEIGRKENLWGVSKINHELGESNTHIIKAKPGNLSLQSIPHQKFLNLFWDQENFNSDWSEDFFSFEPTHRIDFSWDPVKPSISSPLFLAFYYILRAAPSDFGNENIQLTRFGKNIKKPNHYSAFLARKKTSRGDKFELNAELFGARGKAVGVISNGQIRSFNFKLSKFGLIDAKLILKSYTCEE